MSRRITLLVLAASAALIATQASADRECFGESCRLPEVVEPPAAGSRLTRDDAAAPEASAAASKPAAGEGASPGGGRSGDAAARAGAKPR